MVVPQMLLIGATGRDAGKTTFACQLLQHFGASGLYAVKVTVIHERNGECPRGGVGCGVCSSLEGGFCITEENSTTGNKDTQRMLAAGAKRVYWLRTLREEAEEGLRSLLHEIGESVPIICESNSVRQVVVPGLFLMVANLSSENTKASAKAVMEHADLIVQSDGKNFDCDFNQIEYAGNGWRLRPAHAALPPGSRRNL